MKNVLLMMLAMVVAFNATAVDRFYIEDVAVNPGETLTLSIMLDNATAYTAFQTDLYLPDGLTLLQEDGDYLIDLTARKARDHNIASQLQTDGSIRIMSYSPRINAYSGNNGALVTIQVTAAVDFSGPATIALKNTLFTTTAGVEVALNDEECVVSVPEHKGDVNGDDKVSIGDVTSLISYLLSGDAAAIDIAQADVNGDGKISIGDVTELINILLTSH